MNYHDLMSRPISSEPSFKQVKVSILSEASTEHFTHFLKIFLADHKISAEIKTHGLNTIEQEILDPNSQYHQFGASLTLILTHSWNLSLDFKPEENFAKWTSLWKTLPRDTITIQTNYGTPPERISGNYDFMLQQSLQNRFHELNRLLKEQSDSIHFIDVEFLSSYHGKKKLVRL